MSLSRIEGEHRRFAMRCEFTHIAFEEALEHVVLGTVEEDGRYFGSDPATTAVLEFEEREHVPCPPIEHNAAD